MKTILTGNKAIEAYEQIQGSFDLPAACGYFCVDDLDYYLYDKGTIIAFDNTDGYAYEESFSNVDEAIKWINI